MLLAEYDIVFIIIKAIKGSIIVYHLADHIVEDDEPLDCDLLDEDMLVIKNDDGASQWWTLYFDGAINVLEMGLEY